MQSRITVGGSSCCRINIVNLFEPMLRAHGFEENYPLLAADRIFGPLSGSQGCGSHDFEVVS